MGPESSPPGARAERGAASRLPKWHRQAGVIHLLAEFEQRLAGDDGGSAPIPGRSRHNLGPQIASAFRCKEGAGTRDGTAERTLSRSVSCENCILSTGACRSANSPVTMSHTTYPLVAAALFVATHKEVETMEKAEFLVDLTDRDPRLSMPSLSVDFLAGPKFERISGLEDSQLSPDSEESAHAFASRVQEEHAASRKALRIPRKA